jgi:hypothetical protein
MLSNIASYIFGSSVEPEVPTGAQEEEAKPAEVVSEDEWVLVEDRVPALNLGSLNDIPLMGSTGSSEPSLDSEDSEDVPMSDGAALPNGTPREPVALTRTARRLTIPFGSLPKVTSLSDIQCVKASQSLKVKASGKHLTSKALERRNKAVKQQHGGSGSRKSKAPTMALRAAGASRQLKQC